MPSSDVAVKGSDDSGEGVSTADDEDDEIEDGSPPRDRAERSDTRMYIGKPKPLSLLPFFRLAAAMEGDRKCEEKGEVKRFRPVPELEGERVINPAVDRVLTNFVRDRGYGEGLTGLSGLS